MVEINSVQYAYPGAKAIRFADFKLAGGEHCLLLGESGSGKTTLLHLLGGLLRSQQGTIRIHDTDITQLSESALDHFRGKHLGFVFQRNHLLQALSVRQNLLMAPFLAALPQREERVNEVLDRLGLLNRKSARVRELSQGQAQRVAIARAVINKPDVIFADEPTSALDDKNCERVTDLLLSVASEQKATLVVATHDQRLKAKITRQMVLPA